MPAVISSVAVSGTNKTVYPICENAFCIQLIAVDFPPQGPPVITIFVISIVFLLSAYKIFIPFFINLMVNSLRGTLNLCTEEALVKGEKCFVNFKNIIVFMLNEVFNYDIEFIAVRQGKAGFHKHFMTFVK